jgi:hypothetical protein
LTVACLALTFVALSSLRLRGVTPAFEGPGLIDHERRRSEVLVRSSSGQQRNAQTAWKTRAPRSTVSRRLVRRGTRCPGRPAGRGRRRVGGRIAGGKGRFERLVEILLRLGARLARRLSRLFHPGGSVGRGLLHIGCGHRGREVRAGWAPGSRGNSRYQQVCDSARDSSFSMA